MTRPLAIDLFCGLGGWTEGLLAEGYDVTGYDIEEHSYGDQRYPARLVLQDVLALHGSQFRDAALIVASPPCQEFSYMAMPWTRAKQIKRALEGTDEFPEGYTGSRTIAELTALFGACFRIQREASEAAGCHIPMVVENVRGAIPWVGRSRWNFGSFHLWGDVPALMPTTIGRPALKIGIAHRSGGASNFHRDLGNGRKVPGFRFDGSGRSFQSASVAEHDGVKSDGGTWFGDYQAMKEGIKQRGSGREWFAGDGKISRMTSSKSPARKAASAMIAKIPITLSRHIAAVYHPDAAPDSSGGKKCGSDRDYFAQTP